MNRRHGSGHGVLYRGETRLAIVSYSLTDDPPTPQGLSDPPRGMMEVIQGDRDLIEYAVLTLHMEDGQQLDVTVRSQEYGSPYRIDGLGAFRRP